MSRTLRLAAADVKLSHSVFALPFAVLASFLARDSTQGWSRFGGQLALVVVCMVFARTWAMLVNRLADRSIDARNERTRRRVFAAGDLSPARGWTLAFAMALAFVASTSAFWLVFDNPWPLLLSVPTLAWLAFYSFTKRFTALCHLVLGLALGFSPIAAAIAIRPEFLAQSSTLWWIAAFVVLWVAGFDVIYALQDIQFDRAASLFSIPARLGEQGAAWTSRILHMAAFVCLVSAWTSHPPWGPVLGGGVLLVGVLLVYEHYVVAARGLVGVPMAFFTVNGIVSCVLGLLGCLDHVW
jgi:4-hydroxybenzoate polyprenyltransferase